jgi:hypothetical protein
MLDTAWGSRDGVSAGERRDRCSGYARVAQEEAGPLTKESVGVEPHCTIQERCCCCCARVAEVLAVS